MRDEQPSSPTRPKFEPKTVYREDAMRAALNDAEWNDYVTLDVEAQLFVAHMVLEKMAYSDALRLYVSNKP